MEALAKRKLRTSRATVDETFLGVVDKIAERSTCARRAVGAVLVDGEGHVISTGYNGVPPGEIHCIEQPCSGATRPSGEGLNECRAIHAEINCLKQAEGRPFIGSLTLYVKATPCEGCAAKIVENPKILQVVASEVYPHPEALELLKAHGVALKIVERNLATQQRNTDRH
jgi:dCMP deaminase